MSDNHSGGNLQPTLDHEEHDGLINAKRVSLASAATIYAVVNTSGGNVTVTMPGGVTVFQGTSPWVSSIQGNLTLSDSKGFIGLTTVVQASSARTITGNLTLSDAKTYIGLTTATIGNSPNVVPSGNVTLNPSPNFIGIATVVQSSSARTITGNLTLSDSKAYVGLVTATVGNSVGISGNLTLSDSKTFIGLTTTTLGASPAFIGIATVVQASSARSITGNVTLDAGSKTQITGNLTLSDSKAFIGLTTTVVGTALPAGANFIGLVTVNIGSSNSVAVVGNVTLSDSKGYIGLVTVTQASAARTITGNLTLSDAKTSIGLVTLNPSSAFIGLTTVIPSYQSNTTSYYAVVSATGNNTIFVAPASNYFYLKDIFVSSLGRSELEIRSGATGLLPFTALATTGGYVGNFGETGLKSRAPADSLGVNLNGGATVAVMANVRFQTT